MNKKEKSAIPMKSLLSVIVTLSLASITHAYVFGYRAIIGFGILGLIACLLFWVLQQTKNKPMLVLYGFFNGFVFIGFGLVNGFWNHTIKVLLKFLHNGVLPPPLQNLFFSPEVGSWFHESIGILTFIVSLFAVFYSIAFIKETLDTMFTEST